MWSTISYFAAITAIARTGVAALDLGHHPPNATRINNLTSALYADGAYGFAFDGSYPDVPYGTYVWGNMPHVRRQEYVVPGTEYKLRYVELIHRHHKRTVYAANSFPVESYGWDCNEEGLFYSGQPLNPEGNTSAQSYWSQQTPGQGINPFKPTGFLGSCQFPQITRGGLDDSHQHGKDLYGVYHDLLNLITSTPNSKVAFRVTQNVITSQVASMVIAGIYPSHKGPIPLQIQASGIDSLEPTYSCPASSTLYTTIKSTPTWTTHLSASSPLFQTLDSISGVPSSDPGFHASLDHYYDNLSARQCHSKPLPCSNSNSTTCITQSLANTVYRLGQWEYSYLYRDNPSSLTAAVASFGVWIAELSQHFRDAAAGKSEIVYFHNIAHDGSIARLLSILQIEVMVWPGMGSEVVFEVWEKDGDSDGGEEGFYLRVLFGGRVLKSSSPTLGVMDMVPLERVLGYFDGLVGVRAERVVGLCNGTVAV